MTDISTYKKELYEIYELVHDEQTAATAPTLTVTGKKPHADVIASSGHKLERTRVYANGQRIAVTEVALSTNDTVITVGAGTISSGDEVDIFLAATTGTLENNTTVGKIPLIELQAIQGYGGASNKIKEPGCGTSRTGTITFSAKGIAMLTLHRRGNDNMKNFISARKNKKYLMIIVKDTTVSASPTYDILHEARVRMYSRGSQARNTAAGIVFDSFGFSFVPDAKVTS